MNTQVLLFLDNQWNRLDLYEDVPISINIQEVDITDFETRKSIFSKQFVIPATSNNSNIFEHYFEVNGIEFDPLVKVPAVVQYKGTDIFNGILRLNSVIVNPTYTDFEVYIMGEVGDFISEIKNLTLRDLDYTDLQHENSYSAVTLSWEAKDNDTDGLFGGQVLYPLINYGLFYPSGTGATPAFTYTFDEPFSFDQSGNTVAPEFFKPSIRVKSVIDRLFSQTSYTLESEFFETDYFKSIYMDTFVNGKLGIESASAVTNQNIFKVYQRGGGTSYRATSLGERRINFESFRDDGYDPLNNFTLGTPTRTAFNPPNPPNNTDYFRVPFAGQYAFNYKFNFDGGGNVGSANVQFQVIARKGPDLNTLDSAPAFAATAAYNTLTAPNDFSVNWFFTGNCQSGEYVRLYLAILGGTQDAEVRFKPYSNGGIVTPAPVWDLYSSPTLTGQQLVDFKLGVPDLDAVNFLKAIILMFNLVVIQENTSKVIKMIPYNWYYNDFDRIQRDFTNKLDHNSTYTIEPLSFDLNKEIEFTYTKGSDEYLNRLFEDDKDYNFGRFKYISTSNLLTGVQKYELPFAPLPTTVVDGANNFIIPAVYKEENGRLNPYSFKPHIFFWVGNRYAYKDPLKSQQGSWYLSSGSTPVEQTTYPCVSHLTSLDISIPSLVSDLSFGGEWDFFANYNPYPVVFSPYTLYNTFWKDYIDNNYSNETRRLRGRFFMKPLDLYETKLTDKIYVKDSFYRIEKITDGDLVNDKLTDISLIKERGGYYKITPPSPYYTLSGNTPYPGPQLFFTDVCYTGVTIGPVCSGTTPTQTLITFGVSGFSNNQVVYYDSGGVYTPVPIGVYLRPTGGTDTFVVINIQGTILEQDC